LIRKHGGYIAGQERMTDTELLAKALQVSERISAEKSARIAELEDEAKVLHFGGEMRTIRDFCKDTGIGLDVALRRRLGVECAAYTRVSGQAPEHQAVVVQTPYGSTGSQVRVYPLETLNHCVMVLGTEEWHVREHQQRKKRRRCRFGGEHMLIPHTHERLLRERRSQVRRDPFDDSFGGASQARIALVACLSERRGGGFSQNGSSSPREILIGGRLRAKLEEPFGIFVFGQETE